MRGKGQEYFPYFWLEQLRDRQYSLQRQGVFRKEEVSEDYYTKVL